MTLAMDLSTELDLMDSLVESNLKSYQIWCGFASALLPLPPH